MPIVKSTSQIDNEAIDIYIEVDRVPQLPDSDNPYQNVRGAKEAVKAMGDLFGDGLALTRKCAVKVMESVKQMDDASRPNELEIQLAIKLNSEVGAAIVKAGSEAQMQVTMKWKLKETPTQP